jgi:hypothetical protein
MKAFGPGLNSYLEPSKRRSKITQTRGFFPKKQTLFTEKFVPFPSILRPATAFFFVPKRQNQIKSEARGEECLPILMVVTRRPQDLSTTPMLLAVTPLPRPLTTPPVTRTYFMAVFFLRVSCVLGSWLCSRGRTEGKQAR